MYHYTFKKMKGGGLSRYSRQFPYIFPILSKFESFIYNTVNYSLLFVSTDLNN